MRKITINDLRLENFKGIRSFELEGINGEGVSIYGKNATGKTTLFDAFSWLLFDKDSLNAKDFDIKPLDENGNPAHGLNHIVQAVLAVNGDPLKLKKDYHEKWTKKRGESDHQFTGHTSDYFLDDVPCETKKKFDETVYSICDEDLFQLLTNPRFFNSHLHWTKRREILLKICGDVQDSEVISSNDKLKDLPEILGKRSVDDHKKVAKARQAKINEELKKIPVRIDEVEKSRVELPHNLQEVQDKIKKLQQKKAEVEASKKVAESGGELSIKQKELSELQAKIEALENKITKQQNALDQKKDMKIYRLNREAKTAGDAAADEKSNLDSLKSQKTDLENLLKKKGSEIESLHRNWYDENDKTLDFKQDTVCPTCGQSIPEDRLEEALKKAQADFNNKKADALKSINENGKKKVAESEKLKKDIAEKAAKISESEKAVKKLENEYHKKVEELEQARSEEIESIENPEYDELTKQEIALQEGIRDINENQTDLTVYAAKIAEIDQKITSLIADKTNLENNATIDSRIENHKKNEQKLSEEFAKLEAEVFLIDEFIRSKVDMLNEKINRLFELARFQLFTININGGLEPCCNTTFNGVPYFSMNNGARINVGLDIINVLSRYYEVCLPIFIDNAESVTSILATESQQIRLVVSSKDEELRVEVN